jgi:hypothetical protein
MQHVENAVRQYLQLRTELLAMDAQTDPITTQSNAFLRPFKEAAAYDWLAIIEAAAEDPQATPDQREYAKKQLASLPQLP